MPYYGDYYAGDPGLFSGIGKIFKGALGIASKVMPGPIGSIAGVASRLVSGTQRSTPFQTASVTSSPRRRKRRSSSRSFGARMAALRRRRGR